MWRLSSSMNSCKWLICALLFSLILSFANISDADDYKYEFPVQPSEKASFSKGGHSYPAIDIFTPKGAKYVAPINGVIEDINRIDNYKSGIDDPSLKGGIWISLIGVDGFRYYASHLAEVSNDVIKGQKVYAGQYLGIIGNSGNAKGTPIHLHFGISMATRPYRWDVRRGEIEPYGFLSCILKKGCKPASFLKPK